MTRSLVFLVLVSLLIPSCTQRKKQDDMISKFCEHIPTMSYQQCYTDLLECYDQSPEGMDDDHRTFVECARLFNARPSNQNNKISPETAKILKDFDEEMDNLE